VSQGRRPPPGCGRTDLPGGNSSDLYFSLNQRLAKVPDDALLFPGTFTRSSRPPAWETRAVKTSSSNRRRSRSGCSVSRDPNDLLCMAWKWQRGDVSRITDGNLEQALRRIKAKTFVLPIDSDMFFPPADCELEQKLIANSELRMIHTVDGHLGLFGLDPEYIGQVDRHLRELLATRA
jgi:homoserine acetyltransferase